MDLNVKKSSVPININTKAKANKYFWGKLTLVSASTVPVLEFLARTSVKSLDLECRKWGFKRWVFKQIRGYPRQKAFFLRFLDFPGAVRALRKREERAEKDRKRLISADFRDGRPDTPQTPICYTPIYGTPIDGTTPRIWRTKTGSISPLLCNLSHEDLVAPTNLA